MQDKYIPWTPVNIRYPHLNILDWVLLLQGGATLHNMHVFFNSYLVFFKQTDKGNPTCVPFASTNLTISIAFFNPKYRTFQ